MHGIIHCAKEWLIFRLINPAIKMSTKLVFLELWLEFSSGFEYKSEYKSGIKCKAIETINLHWSIYSILIGFSSIAGLVIIISWMNLILKRLLDLWNLARNCLKRIPWFCAIFFVYLYANFTLFYVCTFVWDSLVIQMNKLIQNVRMN